MHNDRWNLPEVAMQSAALMSEQLPKLSRDLHSGRNFFIERTEAMTQAPTSPECIGMLVVGLDSPNPTNFHHPVWDRIIVEITLRLHLAFDWEYVVHYIGAGVFAMCMPGDAASRSELNDAACLCAEVLSRPFATSSQGSMRLTCTVGMAATGASDAQMPELLRRAEIALTRARRTGLTSAEFDQTLDLQVTKELALAADLAVAVARRQFEVSYEQVSEGEDCSKNPVKVNVRWMHTQLGQLAIGEVLDLAERHGLLVGIADAVISSIERQMCLWASRGVLPPGGLILSEDCLSNPSFSARLDESIRQFSPLVVRALAPV